MKKLALFLFALFSTTIVSSQIIISNDNKAKLLMVISALSFAIMASIVKATPHSVAIKAFSRQIFSCIFVFSIILINNHRIIPLKKNRIKLLLRCLFGTVGLYLYFYSNLRLKAYYLLGNFLDWG